MTGCSIKQWLEARNLKHKDLARMVGVDPSTISRFLSSAEQPRRTPLYIAIQAVMRDYDAKLKAMLSEGPPEAA